MSKDTIFIPSIPGAFVSLEGHTLPLGWSVETWLETHAEPASTPHNHSPYTQYLREADGGRALSHVWVVYHVCIPLGVMLDLAALEGWRVSYTSAQELFPAPTPGIVDTIENKTGKVGAKVALKTIGEYARTLEPVWQKLNQEQKLVMSPPSTNRRALVSTDLATLIQTTSHARLWNNRPLLADTVLSCWDLATRLFRDRQAAESLTKSIPPGWLEVMKGFVPLVKPPKQAWLKIIREVREFLSGKGVDVDQKTVEAILEVLATSGDIEWKDALLQLSPQEGAGNST